MTPEDDLLRRSMHAAPEEWLDRLVTERVVADVRQSAQPSLRSEVAQRRAVLALVRAWVARLLSPEARVPLWRGGDQRG